MRLACSISLGVFILAATSLFAVSDANAVICARGIYRAGCARPAGAVVIRKTVIANGVAVRRST
jgi:hypothetical protein